MSLGCSVGLWFQDISIIVSGNHTRPVSQHPKALKHRMKLQQPLSWALPAPNCALWIVCPRFCQENTIQTIRTPSPKTTNNHWKKTKKITTHRRRETFSAHLATTTHLLKSPPERFPHYEGDKADLFIFFGEVHIQRTKYQPGSQRHIDISDMKLN